MRGSVSPLKKQRNCDPGLKNWSTRPSNRITKEPSSCSKHCLL